ncbi:MAG: hypothetical protein ACFFD1_00185 [Candidatus Thorarchaeota archaeon]
MTLCKDSKKKIILKIKKNNFYSCRNGDIAFVTKDYKENVLRTSHILKYNFEGFVRTKKECKKVYWSKNGYIDPQEIQLNDIDIIYDFK